ncbi:MAG TPA: hypothetical protein VMT80_00780 [Candidatus Paceibacterota bacterium]|nr:hypothetical protein [Candidatus Paceibacterota bacterium]
MPWAARRRLFILTIVGAVFLAFAAIVYIAFFYQVPSCTDGVQNQDEEGVDCGGSCPYLCVAQEDAPTVLYSKALLNGPGRTDVIALVENKNADAMAKDVPYTLTVFGADQTLIQQVTGTLDLPPGASVPVFVPGINSGSQTSATAFLSIDPSSVAWVKGSDTRTLPRVSGTELTGSATAPRVTATLSNSSVNPLADVPVVVIVHAADGNVIGASRTVIPIIDGQGSATATFTWNSAFPEPPTSIEVIPVIPLP